jgi:hypothetical protein
LCGGSYNAHWSRMVHLGPFLIGVLKKSV